MDSGQDFSDEIAMDFQHDENMTPSTVQGNQIDAMDHDEQSPPYSIPSLTGNTFRMFGRSESTDHNNRSQYSGNSVSTSVLFGRYAHNNDEDDYDDAEASSVSVSRSDQTVTPGFSRSVRPSIEPEVLTTRELYQLICEPENYQMFRSLLRGYDNDGLNNVIGYHVSDLVPRPSLQANLGGFQVRSEASRQPISQHRIPNTNNSVVVDHRESNVDESVESAEMDDKSLKQHQTTAPVVGGVLKIPRTADNLYPFRSTGSQAEIQPVDTNHALMTGTNYESRFFQEHLRYLQDIRDADADFLTDRDHLAKLATHNQMHKTRSMKLRKEFFPVPAERNEFANNPDPVTGSRLEGLVLDGHLLVRADHKGPYVKGEPVYNGPNLRAGFFRPTANVDQGYVVGDDPDSQIASVYRNYVRIVHEADGMRLTDQDFGDLLRVANRKHLAIVGEIRRKYVDAEAKAAIARAGWTG